jgi:hypothetical protein
VASPGVAGEAVFGLRPSVGFIPRVCTIDESLRYPDMFV